MKRGSNRRAVHGVTLIELMVYLTVAAILLAVATPVLLGWRGRTELVAATDLLRADMKMAMSVSAKQNEPVVMKFQVGAQAGEWCYALYKGGIVIVSSQGFAVVWRLFCSVRILISVQ